MPNHPRQRAGDVGLAFIFYRIGESDYGKGWLLALASVVSLK